MKKIFLLMTIMTSLFFALSINSNGYTFNGSYDFSNIDLDASLTELNGASLNDLFDYDYINEEYLGTLPNNIRNKFEILNGVNTFVKKIDFRTIDDSQYLGWFTGYTNINMIRISKTELVGIDLNGLDATKILTNKTDPILDLSNFDNASYVFSHRNTTNEIWISVPKTYTEQDARDYLNDLKIFYELQTFISILDVEQSLLNYNLENINIDLLNYYFAVYLLNAFDLPIGDLWAYAWTAGNDAGYNDGFDDGYDSGYTNGFDTGNLQGYTNGYDFGYNTGYDDGIVSDVDTQWLLGFVTGTVNVLGVSIIPGISLGVFVFIPLFLGFIGFIFRLGGRRG